MSLQFPGKSKKSSTYGFNPIFGNIQYVTHICLSGVKSLTSWSRFYQGGQGGLQGEKYDGWEDSENMERILNQDKEGKSRGAKKRKGKAGQGGKAGGEKIGTI